MDTQNYKRTLAGSVGAGMGALMGASGRTYFILEHKTPSKYHQAGESQKIIVDQVELGRDASCQVRFDESFETVSRKHAAIVRDGENWKLIHLSHSNPTLVNGHPINGSYYLQTGGGRVVLIALLICISEFCPFFRHIRTLKFGVVLFSYIFFGFRGNKC